MRFIFFGSLKNYSNLSGFPWRSSRLIKRSFHHHLWRLPYTEVLVYHKQRVEVSHLNLSIERSWVPFRCWVSLFLTGFTSQRGPHVKHFCHHCGVREYTRPNCFKLQALKRVDSLHGQDNWRRMPKGIQAKGESEGQLTGDVEKHFTMPS